MGKRRRRVVEKLANERQETTSVPNLTLANENSVRLEEVNKTPVPAPEIISSMEEPAFMTTEVTSTKAIAKKKPAKKRTPRKRKAKSS